MKWLYQPDRRRAPQVVKSRMEEALHGIVIPGIELLSLALYSQDDLEGVPDIWRNRKLIFRRGWR